MRILSSILNCRSDSKVVDKIRILNWDRCFRVIWWPWFWWLKVYAQQRCKMVVDIVDQNGQNRHQHFEAVIKTFRRQHRCSRHPRKSECNVKISFRTALNWPLMFAFENSSIAEGSFLSCYNPRNCNFHFDRMSLYAWEYFLWQGIRLLGKMDPEMAIRLKTVTNIKFLS